MKSFLPALLCCGCIVLPNPWFVLDTLDDEIVTTFAPTTQDDVPTSTGSTSAPDTTAIPTTSGPTLGSTSDAESTTGPMTSSEDTVQVDPTTSGGTSSSTSEGSSTAEDSTTGEGMLHTDLYVLCPAPGVGWWGGAGFNILVQCNRSDQPGVSQIPMLDIEGKNEQSILNVSPSLEPMGAVEGRYPFAPLSPEEAMTAKVLAKVHCPKSPDPMKPCTTVAKIEARVNNVTQGSSEASLGDGDTEFLQLELAAFPNIVNGEMFSIVLHTNVGLAPGPYDRAYFIQPRLTL